MKSSMAISLFCVVVASLTTSCIATATDQDLEQMCNHLTKLRGEIMVDKKLRECIDDAKNEKISLRQAKCRISAFNLSEYWIRCRTGKARTLNMNK